MNELMQKRTTWLLGCNFVVKIHTRVLRFCMCFSVGCTNDDDEEEAREQRRRAREERKRMKEAEESGTTDVINTNRYRLD